METIGKIIGVILFIGIMAALTLFLLRLAFFAMTVFFGVMVIVFIIGFISKLLEPFLDNVNS